MAAFIFHTYEIIIQNPTGFTTNTSKGNRQAKTEKPKVLLLDCDEVEKLLFFLSYLILKNNNNEHSIRFCFEKFSVFALTF